MATCNKNNRGLTRAHPGGQRSKERGVRGRVYMAGARLRRRPESEHLLHCALSQSSRDNTSSLSSSTSPCPTWWRGAGPVLSPGTLPAPSPAGAKGESGSSERSGALPKATQHESGVPAPLQICLMVPRLPILPHGMLQATWHTRAFTRPGRGELDSPAPRPRRAIGRGWGRAAGDWSQLWSFRSPDLVADFQR